MFKAILTSTLAACAISTSAFAAPVAKCHTIVAKDDVKTEKVITLDPENLANDLGPFGPLKADAYAIYDEEKNETQILMTITEPDGQSYDVSGINTLLWTSFNYQKYYLSAICQVEKK